MTSGTGATRQVARETFEALMQLLADHPELTPDRVRELIESPRRPRPRAEAVRPRTSAEVVQLLEAKVITRVEARRFMRLK